MANEMTSRERILAALDHKPTDRVPIAPGFMINGPAIVQLQKKLGFDTPMEVYGWYLSYCDMISEFSPCTYVGPSYRTWGDYTSPEKINHWGVGEKQSFYGTGENMGFYYEYSHFPLADVETVEEVEAYEWPKIEWFDFSCAREKLQQASWGGTKAVEIGPVGTVFESSWQMMGLENFMMNLIIAPEVCEAIVKHVADFYIQFYTKVLDEAGDLVDVVFCGDDLGTQSSLLMKPDTYREIIKPHQKRVFDVIHKYGKKVMYHSCGAVAPMIPDLIDAGVDILEALQFSAKGMDPRELKDKYGDKLCFHGGINVQTTLPYGTVEDVIKEVEERIEILGKNGGYILAPSHAIQAGTPPENIIAMMETAKNYRMK